MTVQLLPPPGVAGDVAHDAVDSGFPVKVGGHAYTGTPTAVANNDRVDQWYGSRGQAATMLVDSAGAALTLGTQYVGDSAATATPTGTMVMALGRDAAPTNVSADNDAVPLWATRAGALAVQLTAGGEIVDPANLSQQALQTAQLGDAVALLTTIDADTGAILTSVQLIDNAISGSEMQVDVVTLPGVAGDVAHDAVDSGNPVKHGGKAVSGSPAAVADGDRVNAWFGTVGQQIVGIGSAFTAADAAGGNEISIYGSGAAAGGRIGVTPYLFNGTNYDRFRSGGVTGMAGVSGDTAHDAVDAGNPVKTGGHARSAVGAAVADGDRVDAWYGRYGQQIVAVGSGLTPGDGAANTEVDPITEGTGAAGKLGVFPYVLSGTTWDRVRSGGVTGMQGIAGATVADAAVAAFPITIGGRASTAVPTAVSADGDVVDARFLRTGALTVHVVDAAGAAASLGGGTQYVGDAAATATPTGTISMGLANAAAPSDVSADNDAVPFWAMRNGALAVQLTYGGTVIPGSGAGLSVAGNLVVDSTAATNPVQVGTRASTAVPSAVSADGDLVHLWATRTGALVVDGGVAPDAAISGSPLHMGGRASTAVPTAVSADGDVVDARFLRTGALTVHIVDAAGAAATLGGGAVTNAGTFAVQVDGAALTALQVIDDPVQVLGTDVYTEATSKGITIGAVRRDADTTLVGTTNEFGPLQMDANGRLKVEAFSGETLPVSLASTTVTGTVSVDNAGVFEVQENGAALTALQLIDNAVYVGDAAATSTPTGLMGMALAKAAAPSDVSADNDAVALWALRSGALAVQITAAGALVPGDASNGLDVDVTRIIPGTGATNLGKAIDTAVGATDTGIAALVKRLDTPATLTPASGDYAPLQVNSMGEQYVVQAPHFGLVGDPYTLLSETAQYTTTQTGVALVTPTSGKKLVVTSVQIQAGGTVAGTMQLWFGGSADTTYTRGTDRAIFDGEWAPSATLKPGLTPNGAPWIAGAADDILRVTDSAAINPLTVTVWYYEI